MGTLYVNQITSNIPGKAQDDLVRRRQTGRACSSSPVRSSPHLVALGFDTATEDTAVCAMRDGEVLHESLLGLSAEGKPRHAAVLLEEVERAAAAAGGWEAVDLIAVGVGPGSFTGVRIGIATARGLGASAGLPVAGVCTLDAIGSALRERSDEAESPSLLAVLDARRDEVFAALYSHAGERVWEPLVSAPADLAKRVGAAAPTPAGRGIGGATISPGAGSARRRDP